jgi:hypothetical protein
MAQHRIQELSKTEDLAAISKVFPMYELTIEGLGQAIKKLIVKR